LHKNGSKGAIYALGHSTRKLEELVELLEAHGVKLLCDIRTVPRSRTNPQFNKENLSEKLPFHKIRYRHLKALGGLRRPSPDSVNMAWENASFRGYADYMQTEEFEKALETLITLSGKTTLAIMCAEGNPFRCHRRLVADALMARKIPVFHISSKKSAKEHVLTAFAKVKGHKVSYPGLL
jgi:uncharacterized protein (DUF488 family)